VRTRHASVRSMTKREGTVKRQVSRWHKVMKRLVVPSLCAPRRWRPSLDGEESEEEAINICAVKLAEKNQWL